MVASQSRCLWMIHKVFCLTLHQRNKQWGFVLITNFTHSLMCLFHFSTCFEQPSAHHQENQLYQYIIWYISLCVCGRLVCRSLTCIPDGHPEMMYWYNWFFWWWALDCSTHVQKWNKHIKKCVKLVVNTNCTEMRGQQNIKQWGVTYNSNSAHVTTVQVFYCRNESNYYFPAIGVIGFLCLVT